MLSMEDFCVYDGTFEALWKSSSSKDFPSLLKIKLKVTALPLFSEVFLYTFETSLSIVALWRDETNALFTTFIDFLFIQTFKITNSFTALLGSTSAVVQTFLLPFSTPIGRIFPINGVKNI